MKSFVVLLLFTSLTSSFNHISISDNVTVIGREKRQLDFLKSTRMFFRVNTKENILSWASIWAHAIGFKANMNILNENKDIRPYRRDTYEVLQQLLDFNGFDGQACLLKAFCTASRVYDGEISKGMLLKLLRHIFTLNEHDRKHFSFLKSENCDQMFYHHCPLSFNGISRFTDEI